MEKHNPFEFHDTDMYVACVGENGGTDNFDIREGFKSSVNIMINAVESGGYEDTLIYPVVYNARHSIELSLKIIIEKIIYIYDVKNFEFTDADKSKVYTHDLKTLDDIVKAYYSVDKRIVVYYDQISPYLQDYFFDTKGDVFKYETDYNGNPHLIKLGISSIGYDVLKRKYNEMMVLFDKLIFEMMYLCQEYAVGTFTKNLSMEDIRNIAVKLLPRKQWRNNAFDECKTKIKLEYGIGSKEFSEALNIIQNHREFCTYIDMEQKLGDIPEDELREYVRLVMEMNGSELYDKTKVRAQSGKGLLNVIQEKARKRLELSKKISDDTIALLLVFREYGSGEHLFTENAEKICKYFMESKIDRNDALKKVEKKDIFRRILYGMKKCGQLTYREIIKDEFQREGKELVELE